MVRKITTVADISGAYSSFSSGSNFDFATVPPAINDRGTVAFFARLARVAKEFLLDPIL